MHKHTGPGLIESVYHKCMVYELSKRNIFFQSELQIPFNYDGLSMDINLRCDLFVENTLVVEFKSVEKVLPIHTAQILTYMKLLGAPMGLIINFNCTNIYREGQQTYVNVLYENLDEE